jgi:DNA-binding LacI/PurR family transcriptional regulator
LGIIKKQANLRDFMSIGPIITESESATARPKYRQIYNHLQTEIRQGRLQPGQALPTEVELIRSLGMSRNTVRQALAELENDGIIQRIQGRGTFVTTEQQRHARQQLDVFALIAPELRQGFYPSLVHGFEQASTGCQHQVVVSNSNNDVRHQGDLVLQMIDRSVGGVALNPVTSAITPAYQIRQLQEHKIPVVFCHRTVEGVSAPCVTWSGEGVGLKAGTALRKLGHSRIGLLFDHATSLALNYECGLRLALERDTSPNRGVVVAAFGNALSTMSRTDAIGEVLQDLLTRPNRPTAIFCGSLPDAEQVYLQAATFGLKIPEDLSLIYFGGTWRDHGLAERISCIAVNEHDVGARAAELLHEMRTGKRALDNNERIEFEVTLLAGDTLGPSR